MNMFDISPQYSCCKYSNMTIYENTSTPHIILILTVGGDYHRLECCRLYIDKYHG